MWNLHDGIDWTSAVTTLLIHRFARPPLIKPQVYATYWKLKKKEIKTYISTTIQKKSIAYVIIIIYYKGNV